MTDHGFGGMWTTVKLERLRKYLDAYMTIFKANVYARRLKPYYIDAFAGTGHISAKSGETGQVQLFEEHLETDNQALLRGSARIALDVSSPFYGYYFVDVNPHHIEALEELKETHPHLADRIHIEKRDANSFLSDWCPTMKKDERAVVFLDPYGTQVDWTTIDTIASTEKIDLWLLFPLGIAVTRMLTKKQLPSEAWSETLTRIFGTEDWKEEFYRTRVQHTLFGGASEETRRTATLEQIGEYFVYRLKTIFTRVAEKPLILRNSKNSPLYLLCFAAGNPRAAPTAVKIAQDIMLKE